MPRITPQNYKKLVRVFKALGFNVSRETDDHVVMSRANVLRPVVIPKYPEVGRDIILNNIRTAGITRERYLEILAGI